MPPPASHYERKRMESPVEGSVVEDFRRILGLGVDGEVPNSLLSAYKEYKKMKDVCSAGSITPSELILLCMICGYYHAAPIAPPESVKKKETVTAKVENG